jgi:hypothetical protein
MKTGVPYTIPATHEITIRDLLRHTSGLTYQWNSDLGPTYKDANVASGILPYDGTSKWFLECHSTSSLAVPDSIPARRTTRGSAR